MLVAAVILCRKKWGSWDRSQVEGGPRSPGGGAPGAHHSPTRQTSLPRPPCSQEGKAEVAAVAIALRLVFIIIFFLGASLQEVLLNKSRNWILFPPSIRSREEWLSWEK